MLNLQAFELWDSFKVGGGGGGAREIACVYRCIPRNPINYTDSRADCKDVNWGIRELFVISQSQIIITYFFGWASTHVRKNVVRCISWLMLKLFAKESSSSQISLSFLVTPKYDWRLYN